MLLDGDSALQGEKKGSLLKRITLRDGYSFVFPMTLDELDEAVKVMTEKGVMVFGFGRIISGQDISYIVDEPSQETFEAKKI